MNKLRNMIKESIMFKADPNIDDLQVERIRTQKIADTVFLESIEIAINKMFSSEFGKGNVEISFTQDFNLGRFNISIKHPKGVIQVKLSFSNSAYSFYVDINGNTNYPQKRKISGVLQLVKKEIKNLK